jgi:hypothetical protein
VGGQAVKCTPRRIGNERVRCEGARRRRGYRGAQMIQGVWPGVVGTVPTLPMPGFTLLGGLALPGEGVDRR